MPTKQEMKARHDWVGKGVDAIIALRRVDPAPDEPADVKLRVGDIDEAKLVVIADLAEDERFESNPFVIGPPSLRFYAVARLETPDGLLLGAVCVGDVRPRPQGLTEVQASTLLALARAVRLHLKRQVMVYGGRTAVFD